MSKVAHRNAILPMAVSVLFAFAMGAGTAAAQGEDNEGAYYTNDADTVWKSADGECWYNPNVPKQEPREACGDVIEEEEPVAVVEDEPEVVTRTERIAVDTRALFGFDSANLTEQGREQLRELARKVERTWDIDSLRIIGNTDRLGPESYNQQLSEARAQTVADYLNTLPLGQYPMQVIGVGESNPVVQCENVPGGEAALIECLQPNRRVEVEVTGRKTVTEIVE